MPARHEEPTSAADPDGAASELEMSQMSVTEAKTEDAAGETGQEGQGSVGLKRFLPLALLAGIAAAIWSLGLKDYLTFEALRENRALLLQFVEDQAALAVIVFIIAYAVSTAVSLPGGAFLSVIGGFLFGTAFGGLWTLIGATIGATAIFLVAKTALGDLLRARAGPFFHRMEAGFQENAFSYLLVLRLIPLFPFFVVNLVPAFLGMRLAPYFLATAIGIIPGTFVYATVGAGLGSIFDSGDAFTTEGILTPEIVTALIGLAVLSLLPVIYKKLKASKA